jgi:hypothetical protein
MAIQLPYKLNLIKIDAITCQYWKLKLLLSFLPGQQ